MNLFQLAPLEKRPALSEPSHNGEKKKIIQQPFFFFLNFCNEQFLVKKRKNYVQNIA